MLIAARKNAVVIGSGFGGLAAAIRLGARGYAVTVLEKLEGPGGRAFVHRQDGFTFDSGPTIITAPFLFDELWALCGRKRTDDVTLVSLDPFYQIRFDDGSVFNYRAREDAMRAEVARFCPADVAGYDRFMRRSAELYRVGFEELGHVSFDSWTRMARILPKALTLGAARSVHGLVARYIKDPRLRVVFSFHPLLIGGNPFDTTAIYALIAHLERRSGVHCALGGMGRIVDGLVRLIEGQGGIVRYRAEVVSIDTEARRVCGVTLADGSRIPADIVVSNADSATTYRKLVAAKVRRRWTDRRLARSRYSMSLFVWYFGTDKRYESVGHHTILLGPRYRGLLKDIFTRKVLAKDFSLYLHRPTRTDASLAPPGCDTFYVLSPVPHQQSGIDWRQAAEPYRRSIEAALSADILPELGRHIVSQRVVTPLDFETRLSSAHGAAFGLEPILTQSAWFRPNNRSEEIDGLYLVGAGTHPGAGIPGVLTSAKVLDTVVPHAAAFA